MVSDASPSSAWSGRLDIAGHLVQATIEGRAAVEGVLPALSHLRVDDSVDDAANDAVDDSPVDPNAVTLHVTADDDVAGVARNLPLGPARSDAGAGFVYHDPPSIDWYDRRGRITMRATEAAFADGWIRAQPANGALSVWLAEHGALMLHVGAVEFDGRAALLVGAGGAGKSTTTVTCASAGAGFIGDDFCAVQVSGGGEHARPIVHSVYASAKLLPDADRALGRPELPTLGTTAEGKRVVSLASMAIRSAPIGSLVVLRRDAAAVRPMTSAETVRALRSTAIKVGTGAIDHHAWLRAAAALARLVPAYEVPLTWDRDELVASIASTVAAPPSAIATAGTP